MGGVEEIRQITDDTTRVTLQMDDDPPGLLENVADAVGFVASGPPLVPRAQVCGN